MILEQETITAHEITLGFCQTKKQNDITTDSKHLLPQHLNVFEGSLIYKHAFNPYY